MAEFAYEPGPEIQPAAGESAREIAGKSPWRLAGRRLVRNRLAMVALAFFIAIVVACLLAPVYANTLADTDPFATNVTGTTFVNGKRVEMEVKTGDTVLFAKYAGTEVKLDGEEYLVIRESDLLAIVTNGK